MNLLVDGFRPFFLGVAALASLHVFAWLGFLLGSGAGAAGWSPVAWHAHEMTFGFAGALIAGFLLTAVGNWTGRRVAGPALIAALFLLWLAARVSVAWPAIPAIWSQWLSAAFFPALTVVVAIPIIASRNVRNYPVVALLVALSAAGALTHVAAPATVLRATPDLLFLLMLFIGLRILPFFTGRRLPEAGITNSPLIARLTLATAAVALPAGWVFEPSPVLATLQALAGGAILASLWQWKPWRTLGEPMLWILHVGYLWLAVAMFLRAAGVEPAISIHAVTMGALGCLAIGMMTRVALGHSGRPLKADPYMVASFVLVAIAIVPRLLYPAFGFEAGRFALMLSGMLWAVGFAVYFIRFLPVMLAPRK